MPQYEKRLVGGVESKLDKIGLANMIFTLFMIFVLLFSNLVETIGGVAIFLIILILLLQSLVLKTLLNGFSEIIRLLKKQNDQRYSGSISEPYEN